MNKILITIFLSLVYIGKISGQYRSILSANDQGRILTPSFSTNRLSGELSAAYSSSNVLNFQNPASHADASLTAIEVGTYGENGSFELRDSLKSSGGVGLTHFSFLLPLTTGKSGLGLGFYRSSTTDYSYRNPATTPNFGTIERIQSGNGNSYNTFIGGGLRFKNLKIGANLIANFGNVGHQYDVKFADSLKLPVIRELSSISHFGFSYSTGIQYDIEISKSKQLLLGAYYSSSFFRNGSNQFIQQSIYNQGLTNEQFINQSDTTYDVSLPSPSKLGLGISYVYNRSLLLGTEFGYTSNGDAKNKLDTASLQNAWSAHLGVEYKPFLNRNNDSRKYFNRLTYRLGAIIGKNEQSFSGSINDFKVMGGVTLPLLSRSVGYLTMGLEFQQRNNNGLNQISESILSFRLILTFADKWFIRSKFD